MIKQRVLPALILFCMCVAALPVPIAHAVITSCGASVQPTNVAPYSSAILQFTVTNSDSAAIKWVTITSPSDQFVISKASATGWSPVTYNISAAVYQGGSLASGATQQFQVNVITPNEQGPAQAWNVQVSDDPSGASPYSCTGALSTSLSGALTDVTPPTIYNIGVTALSATSVSINWLTDEPATSVVDYGLDGTHGSTADNGTTLTTDHHVTLSGLDRNTGYHFQITSTDAANNTTNSSDNTFKTTDPPPTPAAPPVVDNSATQVVTPIGITKPLLKRSAERNVPTVKLTTALPSVVKELPTIQGVADDDTAVAAVQYSTDSGKNWLPVDKADGLGGKHVTFSFTPRGLDDGNYGLLVRAIDTSSNVGITTAVTVVIDRLPPELNGSLITLGPQVLNPGADGVYTTASGVDQKLTLSSVGGPTNVSVTAQLIGGKGSAQVFTLSRSADTGLWTGTLNFAQHGIYSLTVYGEDGAGNKTSRSLNAVQVLTPAHIKTSNGKAAKTTVTIHYRLPDSGTWAIWDGSGYGQKNPQVADKSGNFSAFLPAGVYYLEASAHGYHTFVSNVFELKESTPLTSQITLAAARGFYIGSHLISWPSFSTKKLQPASETGQAPKQQTLANGPLPDFTLPTTDGQVVHAADLLGQATDLVAGTTWAPTMSEQLSAIAALQTNPNLNVLPIALQQNAGQVNAYTAITGLKLRWLVDPDSTLSSGFAVSNVPTHYFVDRKGTVRRVVSGVLTQKEMLDILTSL